MSEPLAPPQFLDAEESVLGAMMLSPKVIAAVVEILRPADFYRPSHGTIYRAALDLYAKGVPIDGITLVDELERRGELEEVGGRARINELAAIVPATSNAPHYARIVAEKARDRAVLRELAQVVEAAQDGRLDAAEALVAIERARALLAEAPKVERFRLAAMTAVEVMQAADDSAEAMLVGPLVIRGCRTIIVGDTGHGKTALATQFASAILTGADALGYQGAGIGPALILDLEQGLRTIKRVLRESGLDGRDDLIYVACPDGLALDSDREHVAEVERIIDEHRPVVVILDPYYKAHRGDANEERAVVDLMRILDGLRARYGFALILPAHPRKDPGSRGVRRLTLNDVSGSGAVVRGAELVMAIERLSHGYARLRILKDRDGDLPVGDAWPLIFTRGEGFKLDPKEERTAEEIEERILADTVGTWRTSKEWSAELGIQHMRAKRLLETLAETGRVEATVGPPGRSPRAQCYRTAPTAREQSGAVAPSRMDDDTAPPLPTSIGDVGAGAVDGTAPNPGAVNAPPQASSLPGSDAPSSPRAREVDQ